MSKTRKAQEQSGFSDMAETENHSMI